jgi:hypothetical protein
MGKWAIRVLREAEKCKWMRTYSKKGAGLFSAEGAVIALKKSCDCSKKELWLHLFGVDTALERGVVPTPRAVQAQAENSVSVIMNTIFAT